MASRATQKSASAAADDDDDDEVFTPEMRDRQSRGKDPYTRTGESEEERHRRIRLGHGLPHDTYEEMSRRQFAISVLDNPDALLMYAQSEEDSVAGQRLRFMRMLAGQERSDQRYRNPSLRERDVQPKNPTTSGSTAVPDWPGQGRAGGRAGAGPGPSGS